MTIPHKEVALRGADRMDEVATRIGACNTLVRQPDGGLQGYNTDWAAALDAIERAARRKVREMGCGCGGVWVQGGGWGVGVGVGEGVGGGVGCG